MLFGQPLVLCEFQLQQSRQGSRPAIAPPSSKTDMQIEELLKRLQKVRSTRRGWMSLCPAHEDRCPSLSIAEGARAVLVHCFAGCTIQEIVGAMGIGVRDLYYELGARRMVSQTTFQRKRNHGVQPTLGVVLDAVREAEYLVLAAREIDISILNCEQLDAALNAVAAAYSILELDRNAVDY